MKIYQRNETLVAMPETEFEAQFLRKFFSGSRAKTVIWKDVSGSSFIADDGPLLVIEKPFEVEDEQV